MSQYPWLDELAKLAQFDPNKVQVSSVPGGDINMTYRLQTPEQVYFVKANTSPSAVGIFQQEAAALNELKACVSFRVPKVIHLITGPSPALALEYVDLSHATANWYRFGEALAQLHSMLGDSYGWSSDNYIGTTPQKNTPQTDWALFWWRNRLEPQLRLAGENGHSDLIKLQDQAYQVNQKVLGRHTPKKSLLHGDLWSGNAGFDTFGTPCIYDPASYYGDPETDLALTELFGGFPPAFYEGYGSVQKIAPEYQTLRKQWYNLYHLLNHANLFGGHYVSSSEALIHKLFRLLF